jgi:hypothetical protein
VRAALNTILALLLRDGIIHAPITTTTYSVRQCPYTVEKGEKPKIIEISRNFEDFLIERQI